MPPSRPTATSGCVPPSWRGDTISQGFVENMDFHQLCPGENPGEVKGWQRLQPSQSSWLHLQNRHGHFLQQVLPRCLAWPVHRAAHRHTDGGTQGNSPPKLAERMRRCHCRAGGREGMPWASSRGHWDQRAQPLRAPQAVRAHATRGQAWSLAIALGVCAGRGTRVSAHTRDNTHTYGRKWKHPWPPHFLCHSLK